MSDFVWWSPTTPFSSFHFIKRTNKNEGEDRWGERTDLFARLQGKDELKVYSGLDLGLRVAVVPSRKLHQLLLCKSRRKRERVGESESVPVLESSGNTLEVGHTTGTGGVTTLGLLTPLVCIITKLSAKFGGRQQEEKRG